MESLYMAVKYIITSVKSFPYNCSTEVKMMSGSPFQVAIMSA
jgi:hypothetical protein